MSMLNKKVSRLRRAGRARHKIREMKVNRLSVYRSSNNIYAQVFSPCGELVLTAASSMDPEIKADCNHTGNIDAAKKVGALLAKRCKDAGVTKVAFDRSGYRYHGRVKALADATREGGVEF